MLYIQTIITALLLAAGQSLWKMAALKFPIYQNEGLSLFVSGFKTLFSVYFISGAFLYILATLIYLWLFSKYPFYAVQVSLVSFSIIFSLIISRFIFKESVALINYFGIVLVLIGVILVIWKR
jgi:drug/metabolite transporter (DMT)-like permease